MNAKKLRFTVSILLAASVTVLATTSATAGSVGFVGSLANDSGNEVTEWRTSTTAKTFDPIIDNVYGSRGYTIFGATGSGAADAWNTNIVESQATGLSLMLAGAGGAGISLSHGDFLGATDWDNPAAAGNLNMAYAGPRSTGAAVPLTQSFLYNVTSPIAGVRMGIASDGLGDSRVGLSALRVVVDGNLADATLVGSPNDGSPDMYFFDLKDLGIGDTIEIWMEHNTTGAGFVWPTINGVTFDSLAIPEPATALLIGLGTVLFATRRRRISGSAGTLAVAVVMALATSTTAIAGTVVLIDDDFDDTGSTPTGRIGFNTNGIGTGFQVFTSGTQGPSFGEATNDLNGVQLHNTTNFSHASITSNEVIPVLTAGTSTNITTRRVFIDTDKTTSNSQFVGGEFTDWRFQHGIVSSNVSNAARNDLFANADGGLFINLFYERDTSATDQILFGNIRAATKAKPANSDAEGTAGMVTLATLAFGDVVGGTSGDQHLTVSILTDENGWSFGFSDENGLVSPTVTAGTLSGGWTGLTSIVDAETISFTDEFLNGGYVFAASSNLATGRGSGVIDNIFVQVIPEPSTALLIGLGTVMVACRRKRRQR